MSTIPWLDAEEFHFPPADQALSEPNGLLAVGGDLSPDRLIAAYKQGIFPWFEESQPILWWSPSPRAVLYPKDIVISKSLRKRIRKGEYSVTTNQAFEQVINHCALTPRKEQTGTWITEEMREAYINLHRLGIAHSVEAWHKDTLVGGLYGLAIGHIFFGESMFSHQTDASKVAFAHLCALLKKWDFPMIDCQVTNPFLLQLGAIEIGRPLFSQLLSKNIVRDSPQQWPDNLNHLLADL